jgi:prepilin-type N-terminal cleavage/methylation domain-containing protein
MRILQIGQKSNDEFNCIQENAGFTFIEMVIVISIILSISSLLSIWLGNFLVSKELYLEAVRVSALSDLAKELSGSKGVNFRIYFDLVNNKFWIAYFSSDGIYRTYEREKINKLKDSVVIKSFNSPRSFYSDLASGEVIDYVTFYPDGSCENARLVLENKNGEVCTVYFASTTGEVKVYPYELSYQ